MFDELFPFTAEVQGKKVFILKSWRLQGAMMYLVVNLEDMPMSLPFDSYSEEIKCYITIKSDKRKEG